MQYAGSAIAQGRVVGRIDLWRAWRPTNEEPQWLLLSGATDPPKNIGISKRRTRDVLGRRNGTFLAGVTHDLANMEDVVGTRLFNTVKDLYLTKTEAVSRIKELFRSCERNDTKPMLYYTGHGEIGTGNWCFDNGTISIQEILDMRPARMLNPMIFSDACYSGHWANFCLRENIRGFHCLAACPEYSTATDTKGEGGDLTLYMTGKKLRPRTEPIYSGGNRIDFPISSSFAVTFYVDFIESIIMNNSLILISQSIHNGYFSGCFATLDQYIGFTIYWARRNTFDSFVQLCMEKKKKESTRIYSLACDEQFGFGFFFLESYGTRQSVVRNTDNINSYLYNGFRITACAALESTFYIVMTKDTKEYMYRAQTWFICNTWDETANLIHNGYEEGMIITGICYSSGLGQYFVVMTDIQVSQSYRWFNSTNEYNRYARSDWMANRHKQGFYPTIIFIDPATGGNLLLIVMNRDRYRSDYVCRYNYAIK